MAINEEEFLWGKKGFDFPCRTRLSAGIWLPVPLAVAISWPLRRGVGRQMADLKKAFDQWAFGQANTAKNGLRSYGGSA